MLIKTSVKRATNPRQAAFAVQTALATEDLINRDKEHFYSIGLANTGYIKYFELVALGHLTGVIVCGREIFRRAVKEGVAAVILAHNHPSGDLIPSDEDIQTTKDLITSGRLLGIKVQDHLIVTSTTYLSMRESGRVEFL